MRSYRKRLIAATAMIGVLTMSGYAVAQEILGPASGTTVRQTVKAKVQPNVLPKNKKTPAKLTVGTEAGAARPPRMATTTVYLDKGATIFTKGLATCAPNRLEATDEKAARRACTPAIVGIGNANATV